MESNGSARDTGRAMSEENVEAFKRGSAAWSRGDIEAMLIECDTGVEFHASLLASLGGESTVYRGHEEVRAMFRDVHEAFAELQIEVSEVRGLGNRVVATGRLRGRGRESGTPVESPVGYLCEFKAGKLLPLEDFLDPQEALEAAGLEE
jgi:ketosteroid isomerase-like protein